MTNQTTHVGAAKPISPQGGGSAPSVVGGGGGLGSAIAEGMAFGVGSAMAHRAVDSMLGPRTVNVEHQNTDPNQTPRADDENNNEEGWGGNDNGDDFGGGDEFGGD